MFQITNLASETRILFYDAERIIDRICDSFAHEELETQLYLRKMHRLIYDRFSLRMNKIKLPGFLK